MANVSTIDRLTPPSDAWYRYHAMSDRQIAVLLDRLSDGLDSEDMAVPILMHASARLRRAGGGMMPTPGEG